MSCMDSRDDDSLMDVDTAILHTQHQHHHQLANNQPHDLHFASDDEHIDTLDDIESRLQDNNKNKQDDNNNNGTTISKRELDQHMKEILRLTLSDFSLEDIEFDSPRFQKSMQTAAHWYASLINSAPILYSTQKDSLMSSGGADRMICRCFLSDHYRRLANIKDRRMQCQIIASLVERPVSLLFFKLHEFLVSPDYEFHPVRQSLLHLQQSGLRVNDEQQWTAIQNLMKSIPKRNQRVFPPPPPTGCSWDCRCDCLVCSAISGNSCHMKLLGTCFHQGFAVPQDFELALCWYSLAAVMGTASALNSIGFMYQEGHGVDPDNNQGIAWYFHAAAAGDRTAQYNLACAYYNGCGLETNHEEAFKWYYLAAKRGDVDAQAAVGDQYFQGDGVAQNFRKAFFWHLLSAKGGNVMAQTTVGHHYYFGWAVPRDLKKAFLWHELAAERGYYQGQFYAGHMLLNGEGVGKDVQRAFMFWKKSAQQGCGQAMKGLASLYESGCGEMYNAGQEASFVIERSLDIADYWKEQGILCGMQDSDITYSTSDAEREQFKIRCRKERNLALVMGLHSRLGQQSPITHLQQPSLFDRNIIGLILKFSGNSQFAL